jgi:acid phosphatase (class B)
MKKLKWIGGSLAGGLLLLWGSVFAINTALDVKVGFDYDDTVAFSSPSFLSGREKIGGANPYRSGRDTVVLFWTEVNSKPERDLVKPMTMHFVRLARLIGADPVLITARVGIGREPFIEYWRPQFKEIYFTREKARIMSRDRYLAYFGDSDSDITEAQDAGVIGIRILRHPDSENRGKNNPGDFGEWIVPNSEGPSS